MAKIHLHSSETYQDRMPNVCMACGEPATTHIRKNFAWTPPWVIVTIFLGLLPYVIIAAILTKRMVVEVPICTKHRGYWWKRSLLMYLPLILIAVVGIIAMIVVTNEVADKDAPGVVCLASIVPFALWIIVAAVVQLLMIKPSEITDRSITLSNVHVGFAGALEQMQDEYESGRRRRRFRDEEDEWEERPRRRVRDDYDDDMPPERRTRVRRDRDEDDDDERPRDSRSGFRG